LEENDKEALQALYADFGIEEIFEPDTHIEEMNEILSEKFWYVSEKFWDVAECSEFFIDRDNLKAFQSADSTDIWVMKSPFYTYGQFCSPCAPGAINLDNPLDYIKEYLYGLELNWYADENLPQNNKAYCFDSSWFDDGKAPYRVFRVDNNEEVFPN